MRGHKFAELFNDQYITRENAVCNLMSLARFSNLCHTFTMLYKLPSHTEKNLVRLYDLRNTYRVMHMQCRFMRPCVQITAGSCANACKSRQGTAHMHPIRCQCKLKLKRNTLLLLLVLLNQLILLLLCAQLYHQKGASFAFRFF